ncbi:Uncharacterised protein [BD1-7 clade bacterium]|uniref:PD-(D/E)XK nuclease superfamily protein n=1 Tax=BD1-7 clade bacterium TaxID=2029982 RepID=A0A5S9PIS5_9GAMM|nr:Uncharacterised protein [BD1-7 clade bacterium]
MQDLEAMLDGVEKVLIKQRQQKAMGINDYNPLLSVLKNDDEVRLHSRFIYSMINPSSNHYRGCAFLSPFMKIVVGVERRSSSPMVHREWSGGGEQGGIDLLIIDGDKYYIIENKVWSGDSYRQIARYVMAVKRAFNLSNQQLKDDVSVVYLSPYGRKVSSKSLGKFIYSSDKSNITYDLFVTDQKVENNVLEAELDAVLSGASMSIDHVSYQNNIRSWLDVCLKETANLTNIHQSLAFYKGAVETMLNCKESEVASVEGYLLEKNNTDRIRQALAVEKAMPDVKGALLFDFFESISMITENKLQPVFEDTDDFVTPYTTKKCRDRFVKGSDRGNIGALFSFGSDEVYLCVFAGKQRLHLGVVATKGSKFEAFNELTLSGDYAVDGCELERRDNWPGVRPWYSTEILDDYVGFDEGLLKLFADDGLHCRNNLNRNVLSIIDCFSRCRVSSPV